MRVLFFFIASFSFLSLFSSHPYPLVGFCWASQPFTDMTLFEEGFRTARLLGCQIEHRQYNWNEIELDRNTYDWNSINQWYTACLKYDITPSLALCPVNSNTQIRNVPRDLRGRDFDDPEIISRLKQFTRKLLEKFPEIKYMSFGNEINYYLWSHPEDTPPYLNLCVQMYEYMKENYPEIPVLVIFGFTGMGERDRELVSQFLPACDLVGISTYHACIAVESLTPPQLTEQEMYEGFLDCINLCGGKRFAVVETCAFSYPDPDYQVRYVKVFFDVIEEYRKDMEFACWFGVYDAYPGTLTMAAPFLEQFNSSGLLYTDGTPKASYYSWMEKMSQLGIAESNFNHRLLAAVSLAVVSYLLLKRAR